MGVSVGIGVLSMMGSQAYSSTKSHRMVDNIPSNPIPESMRDRVAMSDLRGGKDFLVEKDDTYGIKMHITPRGRRRVASVHQAVLTAEAGGDYSKVDSISDTTVIPKGSYMYPSDLKRTYKGVQKEALPFVMRRATLMGATSTHGANAAYKAGMADYRGWRDSKYKKKTLLSRNEASTAPGGGILGNTGPGPDSPAQTKKKVLLGGAR